MRTTLITLCSLLGSALLLGARCTTPPLEQRQVVYIPATEVVEGCAPGSWLVRAKLAGQPYTPEAFTTLEPPYCVAIRQAGVAQTVETCCTVDGEEVCNGVGSCLHFNDGCPTIYRDNGQPYSEEAVAAWNEGRKCSGD